MTIPPAAEVLTEALAGGACRRRDGRDWSEVAGVLLDALSAAGYVIVNPQDEESMRVAGFVPGLSVPPLDCTNLAIRGSSTATPAWKPRATALWRMASDGLDTAEEVLAAAAEWLTKLEALDVTQGEDS